MARQEIKIVPAGLVTNPAVSQVPAGALARADNCVLRRPGLVEPRPGFVQANDIESHPWPGRFFQFGDSVYLAGTDETNLLEEDGTMTHLGNREDGTELVWNLDDTAGTGHDLVRYAEANKNVYLTTQDALRRLDHPATGGSSVWRAGLPHPIITALAGSTPTGDQPDVIASMFYRAYRVVFKRVEQSGIVVRSAPSQRALFYNNDTDPAQTTLTISWSGKEGLIPEDQVEVYASRTSPTVPEEEYYLAFTYSLLSTEVDTDHYTAIIDITLDDSLGATLYTSDSQEGIEASHEPPPLASAVAYFAGSLFLGDLTYRQHYDLAWQARGIGQNEQLGDVTEDSDVVSNLTGTWDDSMIGMAVLSVDGVALDPVLYVIAVPTPNTIQLSAPYPGLTDTSVVVLFADVLRLTDGTGTEEYYVTTAEATATDIALNSASFTAFVVTEAGFVWDGAITTADDIGRELIRIERPLPSDTEVFNVTASNGQYYEPTLDLTSPRQSTQDRLTNGLAWSNNLEPEHFQLANQDTVGTGTGRVQALIPTQTALLIFTSTGLYKLSGDGAQSGFRLDLVDQDMRLVCADAAAGLDGRAYAWGDRGVYECTENGVGLISEPVRDLLQPFQRLLGVDARGTCGAWISANRQESEIYLAVPSTDSPYLAQYWLAFNRLTGAWTKWILPAGGQVGEISDGDFPRTSVGATVDNMGRIWFKPYYDTNDTQYAYRSVSNA